MTASRSEFITVRGLSIHVRHWGRVGAPQLFMLHGWMDVSASFQFVVDALQGDWHVIAPDWRGFGLSQRTAGDTYWFPDYVADLDAILRHYSPDRAVFLLGHSMGANVAGVYAGARPERIRKFVNLEGAGMRSSTPEQAPGRYAAWLDGLDRPTRMRAYPNRQAVAARLQQNNPRLSEQRADFLSSHWAALNDAGEWEILGDPLHKKSSPLLYHLDEVMACWAAIKAPVLWVEAADTRIWQWMGSKAEVRQEIDRRLAFLPDLTVKTVADAGHMLHHDQPELLARLVETFLA
ncbi:MAG TPA: alpha/beta hydrolase [Janthinobacterium sp.]|nr:alpha/beta hydrolase [Janthinobacterium sp.]